VLVKQPSAAQQETEVDRSVAFVKRQPRRAGKVCAVLSFPSLSIFLIFVTSHLHCSYEFSFIYSPVFLIHKLQYNSCCSTVIHLVPSTFFFFLFLKPFFAFLECLMLVTGGPCHRHSRPIGD
jgi:hypothetical protein